MKSFDQNTTIFDLCIMYPEIVDVLIELGFRDLANPVMRSTVGKFMTLPKGSKAKGIDFDVIIATLKKHGYDIQ